MSDASHVEYKLDNLAQTVRTKSLRTARTIMLAVGGLTIFANLLGFTLTEKIIDQEIDQEVRKARQEGLLIDEEAVQDWRASAIRIGYLISGAMVCVGILFIALGACIYMKPVPITITALVVYLGTLALFGFLDPLSLMNGLLIKILVVAGLAKSVQSAIAYEQARSLTARSASQIELEVS